MKDIQYIIAKVIGKLKKDKEQESIQTFFRHNGVSIGVGTRIYSNILPSEPYLLKIGSNVTISDHVSFVTHDNSIIKVLSDATDLFGPISIGNNCFIGCHSLVLYGVSICDNVIVAAGSVVCNSITEERVIIAGNPAKIISNWDKFGNKSVELAWNLRNTDKNEMIKKLMSGYRVIKR